MDLHLYILLLNVVSMNIIKSIPECTELGCDPTTVNSNGSLPLYIACINGHLNATKNMFKSDEYFVC